MREDVRKFGLTAKSFVYAVAVHAFIAALLLVSFNWGIKVPQQASVAAKEPVKATVVSEAEVAKQMEAIKAAEEKKKEEELQAKRRVEDLLRQASEAEERRKQEQQRLAELEQKKKEMEVLEREKEQAKAKALAEQRKQEELKKRREVEAQRKRELEEKRKAEAERKRKEEAERQKRLAEQERQRKLAEEKARREAELRAQVEAERRQRQLVAAQGQYIPIIRQKVARNWNVTVTGQNDIEAEVNVRLTASGEVISVKLIRSSGNAVFDRSVENAVYKASPLPIPQERGVNEQFRDLNLKFKPIDLVS